MNISENEASTIKCKTIFSFLQFRFTLFDHIVSHMMDSGKIHEIHEIQNESEHLWQHSINSIDKVQQYKNLKFDKYYDQIDSLYS